MSCEKPWAGGLSFLCLLSRRSLQQSALARQTKAVACMALWRFEPRGGAEGDDLFKQRATFLLPPD